VNVNADRRKSDATASEFFPRKQKNLRPLRLERINLIPTPTLVSCDAIILSLRPYRISNRLIPKEDSGINTDQRNPLITASISSRPNERLCIPKAALSLSLSLRPSRSSSSW